MKKIDLETCTLLFVDEIPSDAEFVHMSSFYENAISYKTPTSLHYLEIKLPKPKTKWELLGKSKELTEEQAKQFMPSMSTNGIEGVFYSIGKGERYIYKTAIESFASLKQANGIVDQNKYGDLPRYGIDDYGKSPIEFSRYEFDSQRWYKEQSLVKDYLLLIDKK